MIYDEAIRTFGAEKQMMKSTEEASELIHAVVRFLLSPTPENRQNVLEERVDMQVMLEQIDVMLEFTGELVRAKKSEKLIKLQKIIDAVIEGRQANADVGTSG